MARKGWTQLSADYRKRLEKNGVSRSDYESGQSIRKARGHGETPERPSAGNAAQFPRYWQERNRLIGEVQRKKDRLFGQRPRFNAGRSVRNVRAQPVSMAQLRWAVNADEGELVSALISDPTPNAFMGYH